MKRSGGILLHITSLPGTEGIGTLGEEAFRFIDQLAESGTSIWQILPLGPTGFGNSPYQCYSAFAGNPLLINLEKLAELGLLQKQELSKAPRFSKSKIDFDRVEGWKYTLLRKAYAVFKSGSEEQKDRYKNFLNEHGWWLNDYALFMACREQLGNTIWTKWEEGIKFRDEKSLNEYRLKLQDSVNFQKFSQFMFFSQWFQLKEYAHSKGVQIFGDLPLYVSTDSADVWSNPDIFLLDENLEPTHVGGVPPDYFSENGQRWGNPVFEWQRLKARDFDWWIARLHFNLHLFDLSRIDHFRGFESYWSVPANEKTAENGEWMPAMGYEVLNKLRDQIGVLPLIAEDLGVITPEVDKLREDFGLPGMKVLQFAFLSDSENKDLPHNYTQNYVAYTGTHDNNTTRGWYASAEKEEKSNIRKYFSESKRKVSQWALEEVWSSVAETAIAPLQDVLGLDAKARMNTPGTSDGNWGWRLKPGQFNQKHIRFMKNMNEKYGRI